MVTAFIYAVTEKTFINQSGNGITGITGIFYVMCAHVRTMVIRACRYACYAVPSAFHAG
jgi:hypothetical protein